MIDNALFTITLTVYQTFYYFGYLTDLELLYAYITNDVKVH